MRHLIALAFLAQPPGDHWLGADKVKHFLLSAMVESIGVSAARAAGASAKSSHVVGGILTAGVGIGREVHDVRVGKGMSVTDLTWDAAGGIAAASLLNGAR
jgi:uncharacterized protein YfiM (DUF2279 family)